MLKSVSNLKVRGLGFQNTPDCCGKCLAITIQNKNMKRSNAKENSVYNYNPPQRHQRYRKAKCCFSLLSLSSVMSKPKILLLYLIIMIFMHFIKDVLQQCLLIFGPKVSKKSLSFFLETVCQAPQISQVQPTGQGFFQFFLEHSLDFMDYWKSI